MLRLFIENAELELQTHDNRTWTPVQRPYVPSSLTTYPIQYLCICRGLSTTSEIRVVIQMRSGKFFSVKNRHVSRVIDLQELFFDYWGSNEHEFTVPRQS